MLMIFDGRSERQVAIEGISTEARCKAGKTRGYRKGSSKRQDGVRGKLDRSRYEVITVVMALKAAKGPRPVGNL
jgi:hypothetical protein